MTTPAATMTDAQLQSALAVPPNGTLVVSDSGITTANFAGFLKDWFNGGPLTITQATAVPAPGDPYRVIVEGTMSLPPLLVAPGAAVNSSGVVAAFTLTGQGDRVDVVLQYNLIGATAEAGDWAPADSFVFLPATANPLVGPGYPQSSVLATLGLTNTWLVLGTTTSSVNGVDFPTGLFFMTDAATSGPLSLLAWQGPVITLSGPITFTSQRFPELERPAFPWNQATAPQGVLLSGALSVPHFGGLTAAHLGITACTFYLYTPTDATWLQNNSTYTPVMGIEAEMSIPSASQTSVTMTTPIVPGCREYLLDAEFSPALTIADLASLFDLTGATSATTLTNLFPAKMQAAVGEVENMGLENLAISFQPAAQTHIVGYTFFTIGMGLSWEVVPGYLTVTGLASQWYVHKPYGGAPGFSVSLLGTMTVAGVELDVEVDPSPDFTVQAEAKHLTLPLQTLVSEFFTGVTPPADLTIDELYLMAEPAGGDYTVGAKAESWSLTVGTVPVTVKHVAVEFSGAGGAPSAGTMSGTVDFGNHNVVDVSGSFPGSTFLLSGQFPQIGLQQLAGFFVNPLPSYFPDALDYTLADTSVLIQSQAGGDYLFQAGTQVANTGSLAVQAQEAAGATGVAVGLAVEAGGFSDLARKLGVDRLTSQFTLNDVVLIVSTFASPTFTFPPMAVFGNSSITAKRVGVPAGGVVAGLNLYASMTLGTASGQAMIAGLLDLANKPVNVTLQVSAPPSASSSLTASATANVAGGTLAATFGAIITASHPAFFLTGTYTTTLSGQTLAFPVTAAFTKSSAYLSGSLPGSLTVEKMTVSGLTVQAGVNAQGGTSLGVCGAITLQGGGAAALAVVFDPKNAAKSMIAGSVSGGTLAGLVQSIAGATLPAALQDPLKALRLGPTLSFTVPSNVAGLLDDLDAAAVSGAFRRSSARVSIPGDIARLLVVPAGNQTWYLTDLTTMSVYTLMAGASNIVVTRGPQMYFAPDDITIGATTFTRGFSVSGLLALPGVSFSVSLVVSSGQGISAQAALSPIDFYHGALKITGSGGVGGPSFSLSTFGAHPHLELSGEVRVLGVVGADVRITFDDFLEMLEFAFTGTAGPASFTVTASIFAGHCLVQAAARVAFSEDTVIKPLINFGSWHYGIALGRVDASVTVALDAGGGAVSASLQGSATVNGRGFTLDKVTISLGEADLNNLVGTVRKQVTGLIDESIDTFTHWLNYLNDGIIKLGLWSGSDFFETPQELQATTVGQTLAGAYQVGANAIARNVYTILGYGADGVAGALQGAAVTSDVASHVMTEMGNWTASEVAAAIQQAYGS